MSEEHPQLLIDKLDAQASDLDRLVTVWTLRLFVRGKGYKDQVGPGGRTDIELAGLLGLGIGSSGKEYEPATILNIFGNRLAELEDEGVPYPPEVDANVEGMATHLGLTQIEADIAAFIGLAESGETLSTALRAALRGSMRGLAEATAVALNQPISAVTRALKPEGRLRRSGLVQRKAAQRTGWYEHGRGPSEPDLEGLKLLGYALLSRDTHIVDFFRNFVRPVATRDRGQLDFNHVHRDVEHLTALLQATLAEGAGGMNVLVHGPAGVGKTALAYALIERVQGRAFEVPTSNSEEGSLAGRERFRAVQIAQYMLYGNAQAVLVFDEIEDVFARGQFGAQDNLEAAGSVAGKAWVNRLLEQSPVPTIWVANSLRGIDAAFVRRFDYILELRCPPKAARERMLERALEAAPVSSSWISQQAASDGLTPAQIDQAARLAKRLETSLPQHAIEPALAGQLRRQQRLQGHTPQPGRPAQEIPYGLDHTCSDPPPRQIADGLAANGEGSILMYGPPGTGKTAFAHAVADRLQRPLIARRASDLLSCLVGHTEANMAAMFEEARDLGAVLFIDEADSFLHSRESAVHRWEIAETNELLCQIESFEGVLLIATNLASALDPATMRRFDVKMGFHHLDSTHRWHLFDQLQTALGLTPLERSLHDETKRRFERLEALSPADFAAVARRARRFWREKPTAEHLVEALATETAEKRTSSGATAGFL